MHLITAIDHCLHFVYYSFKGKAYQARGEEVSLHPREEEEDADIQPRYESNPHFHDNFQLLKSRTIALSPESLLDFFYRFSEGKVRRQLPLVLVFTQQKPQQRVLAVCMPKDHAVTRGSILFDPRRDLDLDQSLHFSSVRGMVDYFCQEFSGENICVTWLKQRKVAERIKRKERRKRLLEEEISWFSPDGRKVKVMGNEGAVQGCNQEERMNEEKENLEGRLGNRRDERLEEERGSKRRSKGEEKEDIEVAETEVERANIEWNVEEKVDVDIDGKEQQEEFLREIEGELEVDKRMEVERVGIVGMEMDEEDDDEVKVAQAQEDGVVEAWDKSGVVADRKRDLAGATGNAEEEDADLDPDFDTSAQTRRPEIWNSIEQLHLPGDNSEEISRDLNPTSKDIWPSLKPSVDHRISEAIEDQQPASSCSEQTIRRKAPRQLPTDLDEYLPTNPPTCTGFREHRDMDRRQPEASLEEPRWEITPMQKAQDSHLLLTLSDVRQAEINDAEVIGRYFKLSEPTESQLVPVQLDSAVEAPTMQILDDLQEATRTVENRSSPSMLQAQERDQNSNSPQNEHVAFLTEVGSGKLAGTLDSDNFVAHDGRSLEQKSISITGALQVHTVAPRVSDISEASLSGLDYPFPKEHPEYLPNNEKWGEGDTALAMLMNDTAKEVKRLRTVQIETGTAVATSNSPDEALSNTKSRISAKERAKLLQLSKERRKWLEAAREEARKDKQALRRKIGLEAFKAISIPHTSLPSTQTAAKDEIRSFQHSNNCSIHKRTDTLKPMANDVVEASTSPTASTTGVPLEADNTSSVIPSPLELHGNSTSPPNTDRHPISTPSRSGRAASLESEEDVLESEAEAYTHWEAREVAKPESFFVDLHGSELRQESAEKTVAVTTSPNTVHKAPASFFVDLDVADNDTRSIERRREIKLRQLQRRAYLSPPKKPPVVAKPPQTMFDQEQSPAVNQEQGLDKQAQRVKTSPPMPPKHSPKQRKQSERIVPAVRKGSKVFSNVKLIRNAINHVALAGMNAADKRTKVLGLIEQIEAKSQGGVHYVLAFRKSVALQFRSVYISLNGERSFEKIFGSGPDVLTGKKNIVAFLKYNTGQKRFEVLTTLGFTKTTDAIVLDPKCLSKSNMHKSSGDAHVT